MNLDADTRIRLIVGDLTIQLQIALAQIDKLKEEVEGLKRANGKGDGSDIPSAS